MKKALNESERREIGELLTEIENNADTLADKLDPKRESASRDGEHYLMARHLDAIYKLAKAARRHLNISCER